MAKEKRRDRDSMASILFRAKPKQWLVVAGLLASLLVGFALVVGLLTM